MIPDQVGYADRGGQCYRITHWPEDALPEPGDSVASRWADCSNRRDTVLQRAGDD